MIFGAERSHTFHVTMLQNHTNKLIRSRSESFNKYIMIENKSSAQRSRTRGSIREQADKSRQTNNLSIERRANMSIGIETLKSIPRRQNLHESMIRVVIDISTV
jgi:hypothetical protein